MLRLTIVPIVITLMSQTHAITMHKMKRQTIVPIVITMLSLTIKLTPWMRSTTLSMTKGAFS